MDWAIKQAGNKTVIISGFHSPLELSILEIMLVAKVPVVVVITRKLSSAKLSGKWREAILSGNMAVGQYHR